MDIDWGDEKEEFHVQEAKVSSKVSTHIQNTPRPSSKWTESLELISSSVRIDADDQVSDEDEEAEQNCDCAKRFTKASKICFDAACINFATQVKQNHKVK